MIYSRENYKKKADIKLSVIVPCLNEIDNIKPTQERLKKVCDKLVNDKYEILFVDGGSTDGTKELIKHLCNKCPYTIGIILSISPTLAPWNHINLPAPLFFEKKQSFSLNLTLSSLFFKTLKNIIKGDKSNIIVIIIW